MTFKFGYDETDYKLFMSKLLLILLLLLLLLLTMEERTAAAGRRTSVAFCSVSPG